MKNLLYGLCMVAVSASAATAETALERGRYLVQGVVACGNCHTPMGPGGPMANMELAGGMPIKDAMFTAVAPNITPDKETGIGSWTDDQIITAIREGKRPDGSLIGPPMPFDQYRGISDSDAKAIVAYLRSVPAVKNKAVKSEYRMPLPPAWGPPVGTVAEPNRGDKVAYGAYLAGPLGHCVECHTPMIKGHFDFENQLGAGGFKFNGPWGTSVAANITSHEKDGIAKHSDAEIKKAITTGESHGRRLKPPMPFGFYANVTEADLDAIVAYLRTLPPKPSPK